MHPTTARYIHTKPVMLTLKLEKKKKSDPHQPCYSDAFHQTCVTLTAYNRVDCFTLGKQTLGIIVESIPNTAKIHGNEMERL